MAGTDLRVVQTNANGEILEIPKGNTGEILTQTTSGPTWQPNTATGGGGSSSTDTCCPNCGVMGNAPCPTMISTLSGSRMNMGECMRHCASLTEGGHSDWRVPTLEEALGLYHLKPIVSNPWDNNFWTLTTLETYDSYRVLDIATGELWSGSGGGDNYCHCVR
ncbi:MAG: DUF1566 domain-containing protein [Aureispira sp.]|nr:DUF1566 domain-containing protein [Aureispira sp.]